MSADKPTKMVIFQDTREKKNIWHFPEDDVCRGTITKKVDHGDYTIMGLEHLIFLERKASISEIVMNMQEPRFITLLENAQRYKYRYIIVEASWSDLLNYPHNEDMPASAKKKVKITPGFILSFISRIIIDYDLHVIMAGDTKNARVVAYRVLKDIYTREKDNLIIMPS